MEQIPTVGRIVHYVLKRGHSAGQVRAAMIVRVWGGQPTAAVNLCVYLDGSNDEGSEFTGGSSTALAGWGTSIGFDDPTFITERVSEGGQLPGYQPGTWHWPPRS